MHLCLTCDTRFPSGTWTCPACGFAPECIDGFDCFAPALARDNSDFDPARYRLLVDLEDTSFWFRARNRLILWALGRYLPQASRLMEIGVGTGYVMRAIRQTMPQASLAASDIHVEGLRFAAARLAAAQPGHGIELMQLDARRIPFVSEFDVMCMFDVIEHIGEDTEVLGQLRKALKPGGGIILSVPQHMSLWGPADDIACHQRRYGVEELRTKAEAAGFRVLLKTSFVSLLFPALWAARWRTRRSGEYDLEKEHQVSPAINAVLDRVMAVEFGGIRAGMRLPFGGSQLVVAVRD